MLSWCSPNQIQLSAFAETLFTAATTTTQRRENGDAVNEAAALALPRGSEAQVTALSCASRLGVRMVW